MRADYPRGEGRRARATATEQSESDRLSYRAGNRSQPRGDDARSTRFSRELAPPARP